MNLNPDYNSEMLKLYFKEQNFTDEQKRKLLNNNPFNIKFVRWEKNTLYHNRLLANTIRRKNLIDEETVIQEVTNHEYNSISKYLNNPSEYYTNFNFFKRQNGIILIHDTVHKSNSTVKLLCEKNSDFITGICTKDYVGYKEKLLSYKQLLKKYKNIEIIEALENGNSICMIKKCR